MSAVESSCTLFRLPRELRDEIYSYCFERAYKVFWPNFDDEPLNRFRDKPVLADLSILRTSTALSSDAKNFLFCRGASKATTFRYHIDFTLRPFSPPPVKEATDRMMNVEFYVILCSPSAGFVEASGHRAEITYPASLVQQFCEETLDRFTGTAIFRNSFWIRLFICLPNQYEDFVNFVNTRLFQALKSLKGFQKLTICVWIMSFCNEDDDSKVREGLAAMVEDLETHLGPCIDRNIESPFEEGVAKSYNLDLEFQPRKHYIESLRAEGGRAIKGVDGSVEEHTQ